MSAPLDVAAPLDDMALDRKVRELVRAHEDVLGFRALQTILTVETWTSKADLDTITALDWRVYSSADNAASMDTVALRLWQGDTYISGRGDTDLHRLAVESEENLTIFYLPFACRYQNRMFNLTDIQGHLRTAVETEKAALATLTEHLNTLEVPQ